MQVHYSIEQLPAFKGTVLTIGTFDGVHSGHKKIIDALLLKAGELHAESVIITFHPHPRKIVGGKTPLQLINTLEEKIMLLSQTGIDHLVIVPFTTEFSDLSAEDYIEEFLMKRFHPRMIIIGYDHHFGKGRTGNYLLLEQRAEQFGYELVEIPKYILDEIGVSSTKIRNAILGSDIETANKLLGYPFFFEGVVVKGDQLGRTLGYPTANLEFNDADKIHLGHGVYAAEAELEGRRYKGMLSIGTRPTLASSEEKVEVHIFDLEADLYEKTIRVIVKKFLRAQKRYASLEELREHLHLDKQQSLEALA